ncbi:MAG: radical SAM protein [Pseudomonadota bacterium]
MEPESTSEPTKKFEPRWLAWEITGRCNLACIHCRASATNATGTDDCSTAEALRTLDDIASYAKPVIVLSGGEPLLRADIFDVAAHGTALGLRMCMATNGILITPEVCARLKESGIRMVSLSLDGSTAEVHDNFRNVPGAFEGIMRGAALLRDHGMEFLINSSFTRRNQHDIANVFRLAKEIGATAWYLFMIVPTGRGKDIMAELITKEDYEEILRWHFEQELNEDKILMRPTCAPQYYRIYRELARAAGVKFERRNLKFSTGGSKGCIAGQLICLIDHHGNVQPCSYLPRVAGNVRRQAFKDIWENSALFQDLRDFSRYRGKCGSCEYIKVCGGCRARADAVHGHYLEEEPFCDYIPARLTRSSAS